MVDRAVLGSMDRFIAILLEHYEGWLPVWQAPEAIVVASISDAYAPYAMPANSQLPSTSITVFTELAR